MVNHSSTVPGPMLTGKEPQMNMGSSDVEMPKHGRLADYINRLLMTKYSIEVGAGQTEPLDLSKANVKTPEANRVSTFDNMDVFIKKEPKQDYVKCDHQETDFRDNLKSKRADTTVVEESPRPCSKALPPVSHADWNMLYQAYTAPSYDTRANTQFSLQQSDNMSMSGGSCKTFTKPGSQHSIYKELGAIPTVVQDMETPDMASFRFSGLHFCGESPHSSPRPCSAKGSISPKSPLPASSSMIKTVGDMVRRRNELLIRSRSREFMENSLSSMDRKHMDRMGLIRSQQYKDRYTVSPVLGRSALDAKMKKSGSGVTLVAKDSAYTVQSRGLCGGTMVSCEPSAASVLALQSSQMGEQMFSVPYNFEPIMYSADLNSGTSNPVDSQAKLNPGSGQYPTYDRSPSSWSVASSGSQTEPVNEIKKEPNFDRASPARIHSEINYQTSDLALLSNVCSMIRTGQTEASGSAHHAGKSPMRKMLKVSENELTLTAMSPRRPESRIKSPSVQAPSVQPEVEVVITKCSRKENVLAQQIAPSSSYCDKMAMHSESTVIKCRSEIVDSKEKETDNKSCTTQKEMSCTGGQIACSSYLVSEQDTHVFSVDQRRTIIRQDETRVGGDISKKEAGYSSEASVTADHLAGSEIDHKRSKSHAAETSRQTVLTVHNKLSVSEEKTSQKITESRSSISENPCLLNVPGTSYMQDGNDKVAGLPLKKRKCVSPVIDMSFQHDKDRKSPAPEIVSTNNSLVPAQTDSCGAEEIGRLGRDRGEGSQSTPREKLPRREGNGGTHVGLPCIVTRPAAGSGRDTGSRRGEAGTHGRKRRASASSERAERVLDKYRRLHRKPIMEEPRVVEQLSKDEIKVKGPTNKKDAGQKARS